MRQTARQVAMPCCGRELVVALTFEESPAPGTTVDVECPYCGEAVALVLYVIPVNRN